MTNELKREREAIQQERRTAALSLLTIVSTQPAALFNLNDDDLQLLLVAEQHDLLPPIAIEGDRELMFYSDGQFIYGTPYRARAIAKGLRDFIIEARYLRWVRRTRL
jgi:hypothetical protein